MYFMPAQHDGGECHDGGLRENNPVQVALAEARAVWGSDAAFDLVASLGCGEARWSASPPRSTFILGGWLADLFSALIATMNGNAAWEKFARAVDPNLLDRCSRLNVRLQEYTEPALDDVGAVGLMRDLAKRARFQYQAPAGDRRFAPVLGRASADALEVLADRLKGSLYFFELRSITHNDEVSIVKGWICCRLRPGRECHARLMHQTSHFLVNNQVVGMPRNLKGGKRLKLEVSFQQQASLDGQPLRIDVKFEHDYYVTISGFPKTLHALESYWETR